MSHKGLLLLNKPENMTSFQLVRMLRKKLNVQKIGHAGTLDPFASGLMIMLIGREFTKLSDTFLNHDKEYIATLVLGSSTDTFDRDGTITKLSDYVPTLSEIEEVISHFQGTIQQIPPMYSAKKQGGKKLYELARAGIEVVREPVTLNVQIEILSYNYPELILKVNCSKGTYIRSLSEDIGKQLTCYAHLNKLTRTRSGPFHLKEAIAYSDVYEKDEPLPFKIAVA